MARNTQESSRRINVMGMANSDGRTAENTKDSGSKESSMELVFIEMLRVKSVKANGMMAKELPG